MSVDTYNQIQPFQAYDTNISTSRIAQIASRYSFVWACSSGISARAWRAANPNIDTSAYIPVSRDSTNNLAWYIANHPDWVLYQADRVTPAYLFGSTNAPPLDFSNSAVQSWFITNKVNIINNNPNTHTYVAVDNCTLQNMGAAVGVYAGATPGSQFSGTWTALYDGTLNQTTYITAFASWIQILAAAIQAHSLKCVINFDPGTQSFTSSTVTSIVSAVDAIFDEGGFSAYGMGNISGSSWSNRVNFMQTVQSAGKVYLLVHGLPDSTNASLEFGLSSYLMGKGHSASIYVSPLIGGLLAYNTAGANEEYWYSQYTSANLGSPLEDMTLDQSVDRRNYSGGRVLVNPNASSTFSYTLPSGAKYVDPFTGAKSGILSVTPVSTFYLMNDHSALFPSIGRRGSPDVFYFGGILKDTPTAYYRLGESSGTVANDSSGNSYNATINGGTGVTKGQVGALLYDTDTSMLFDGSTGFITLPSGVNVGGWSHISLEGWINLSNYTALRSKRIFSNDIPSTSNHGIELFLDQNAKKVSVDIGNGTTFARCTAAQLISLNTWYHVVATWDGVTITLYVNGVVSGSTVSLAGSIGTPSTSMNIAKPATYGNDYWVGLLDEAAIYNYTLTPLQILSHYQQVRSLATLPSISRRQS